MNFRQKRSLIWSIDKNVLETAVKNNQFYADILKELSYYRPGGGIYSTLRKRIEAEKIDISHLKDKGQHTGPRGRQINSKDIFVANSPHSRACAKNRILKENLIPYICSECNSIPCWNNKKLVLILDHINGIKNDHRLKNLRFLCPNCNSQTDTFSGKNIRH